MKEPDDLKRQIDIIEQKMHEFRKQQEKICEDARNNQDLPFLLKFKIWSVCAKQKNHLCALSSEKFPSIKVLLDRDGYPIGEKINVFDKWGDKFDQVINGEITDSILENAMVEIFNADIGSFSCLK